ncbi:MAG TPA: YcxB family protein [Spirochaetota bacterium]|mgnify:FL=1|nr:YcxB family protein [Spirochaetota bacterium]
MKEFKISLNDYMNAQNLFLGWKRWIIQLFIIPVIIYLFIDNRVGHYPFLLISFILILVAAFAVPSMHRKRFRKIYLSNESFRKSIKVMFDDNFIEWISDSGTDRLQWKDIYRYKISREIIIILSSRNIMHPIPGSAFENSEELDRFLKLLKAGKSTD